MAWITPKTDWVPSDGVDNGDFNRIEGDITFIASNPTGAAMRLAPSGGNILIGTDTDDATNKLQVNGGVLAGTVDTGQGANELYGMNQGVKTTDTPFFATGTSIGGIIMKKVSFTGSSTTVSGAVISAIGVKTGGTNVPAIVTSYTYTGTPTTLITMSTSGTYELVYFI